MAKPKNLEQLRAEKEQVGSVKYFSQNGLQGLA